MGVSQAAGNGLILHHSWCDDAASVTASSEDGDLVATNLIDQQPGRIWRTDGAVSSAHADFSLGAIRPLDTFCLWNHNLNEDDIVRIITADDAGLSENVQTYEYEARYTMQGLGEQPLDVGPLFGEDQGYKAPWTAGRLDPPVAAPYVRVQMDPVTDKVLEAGRIMIGSAWQPGVNFDWGINIRWVDPSKLSRMHGGALRYHARPKFRAGEIHWSWGDDFDARQWHIIAHRVGKGKTVLVMPFPDKLNTTLGREQTVLARITNIDGPRYLQGGFWGVTASIEEAI